MDETQEPKPKKDSLAQTCGTVCAVGAFLVYEAMAPAFFGNPAESGFSILRIAGAAVAGGVGAMLGLAVGELIEKIRG